MPTGSTPPVKDKDKDEGSTEQKQLTSDMQEWQYVWRVLWYRTILQFNLHVVAPYNVKE